MKTSSMDIQDPSTPPLRIAFSCGELSGDEHGAHVAEAIRNISPLCVMRGMGGKNLRNAQVETIIDSEKSGSVMGFLEVARSFTKIRHALRTMRKLLHEWQPHILIVIDYPDFNLRLAKTAHDLGIPVLYFIPPKLWAWRKGRIAQIKKYVSQVAVIFPHELEFYRNLGYHKVQFVGHPFADISTLSPPTDAQKEALRKELGLPLDAFIVALLPGSRSGEIARHLHSALRTAEILSQRFPHLQFVTPIAPSVAQHPLIAKYRSSPLITFTESDSQKVLRAADIGLLKSGTSNLQAAFIGLPFVMFYRASKAAAWIVKQLVKIKEYSPVNIIIPQTVEELVQERTAPECMAEALSTLIASESKRKNTAEKVLAVAQKLKREEGKGSATTYERVARIAIERARQESNLRP